MSLSCIDPSTRIYAPWGAWLEHDCFRYPVTVVGEDQTHYRVRTDEAMRVDEARTSSWRVVPDAVDGIVAAGSTMRALRSAVRPRWLIEDDAPSEWRALSLTRPWDWVIVHGGKPIENRQRRDGKRPPIVLHRGPLLLHAAQSFDPGVPAWCAERGLLSLTQHREMAGGIAAGAIVGACRVVGHIEPPLPLPADDRPTIVMGCRQTTRWSAQRDDRHIEVTGPLPTMHTGQLADYAAALDLRWWMGGYAMVLADVIPVPTVVTVPGKQGLWKVPMAVVQRCGLDWA